MKNNIKDVRFTVIDSIDPTYVEVVATYVSKGVNSHRYYFINTKKGLKTKDYLKEARIRFDEDVKNDRIKLVSKKKAKTNSHSPLLIALSSVLAATTLTFAGLFTYKMLQPGGGEVEPPEPPTPEGDIVIGLDEDTSKNMNIEPSYGYTDKEYDGVITLKETDHVCDLTSTVITTDGNELVFGVDYTIKLDGKNDDNKYQYKLKINADKMSNDISIKIASSDISMVKMTQDVFEQSFAFVGPEYERAHASFSRDGSGYSEFVNYTFTKDIYYAKSFDSFNSRLDRYSARSSDSNIIYNYDNYGTGDVNLFTKSEIGRIETLATNSINSRINFILSKGIFKIEGPDANSRFDEETLSYVYDGEPIPLPDPFNITIKYVKTAYYDKKPTSCNVILVEGSANVEYHFDYSYHVKDDPVLPSDDKIIVSSIVDIDETSRASLFDKCSNATNFYSNINAGDDDFTSYFDNDKFAIKSSTANVNKRFNKLSEKEYEGYEYNNTEFKWEKMGSAEAQKEYEMHSRQAFVKKMKFIKDNKITIGDTEGVNFVRDGTNYVYKNESATEGFARISFKCTTYETVKHTNVTVLSEIEFTDAVSKESYSYENFTISSEIHVEMPEVK